MKETVLLGDVSDTPSVIYQKSLMTTGGVVSDPRKFFVLNEFFNLVVGPYKT